MWTSILSSRFFIVAIYPIIVEQGFVSMPVDSIQNWQ
jgi:hypothetical protein